MKKLNRDKKSTGLIWIGFYKPEIKKIKSNWTQTEKTWKKLSQTKKTKPNWFEPVFILKKPNWVETGRFESILIFFKIN